MSFLSFDDKRIECPRRPNKHKKNMSQIYQVRSGALAGFFPLVASLNGDPAKLLKAANIQPKQLEDVDTLITFESMVSLLELCASELHCPDFGLRLSEQQGLSTLGVLGMLMGKSTSVREAVLAAQRYMAIHSQGEFWRLDESQDLAIISRFNYFYGIESARQYVELGFGLCYRLLRLFIGAKFQGARLDFAHSPVSSLSRYRQFFAMEVSFNQEHSAIRFPRTLLDEPLQVFDQSNRQEMETYIAQLCERHSDDIEHQVRTLIMQTLGIQEHSLEHIASLLNMNKRTLQRKLAQQGLNFKDILTDVRMTLACWQLTSSDMSLTLMSEMLGYTDISAFSKAFKHQLSISPLQFRQQARQLKP